MADPARPLSAAQIRGYLAEVADALPRDGPQLSIVMVGGSLLAWHGLRRTTVDVDSVRRLTGELREAAATVARRHDLDPHWLNDKAAGFAPAGLRDQDAAVLLDRPRLRVLGAPLDQVFLMKLFAARSRDVADLVALWPHAGFGSPDHAARRLHEAYPHLERDPHLVDFIGSIAKQAGAAHGTGRQSSFETTFGNELGRDGPSIDRGR